MIYRNVKTGAEIITNSVIKAPNWELLKASSSKMPEAPKAEPLAIEEEQPVTEPIKAPKKATKKRTKK